MSPRLPGIWGALGSAAGSGRGGSPSHQALGTSISLYFSRVVGGRVPSRFRFQTRVFGAGGTSFSACCWLWYTPLWVTTQSLVKYLCLLGVGRFRGGEGSAWGGWWLRLKLGQQGQEERRQFRVIGGTGR